MSRERDRLRKLRPFGAVAAFFAGTLALLELLPIRAAVHLDTARDLLLARDCVLGGHCGAGPRSSFGGWTQGALWSHLLELREQLGLGLAALEHAANLSLAVAAALVPIAARSLERSPTALTWAIWFPATLLTIGYPNLWNPTLWPLVLLLLYLALSLAVRTRGLLAFVVAAAALALAVDVHVASAVLLPFLVATVVACAARPLPALALAAAVTPLVLWIDSPQAFADNRELVARHAPTIALVLALAAAAGWALRRRFAALDAPARLSALLRALCLYCVVVLPLLAIASGHPLHARYLAPLVTPAAILLGAHGRLARSRPLRLAAVALAVAGYLAVWLGARAYNHRYRLAEVEPIAAALYGRGLAFGDLYEHLRGPHAFDLLSTLAALEPPDGRDSIDPAHDLLIVRAAKIDLPASPPPDWLVIDLGAHAAVIVAYEPRLRTDAFEVCSATGDDTRCQSLGIDTAHFAQSPESSRWADRAHASLPGLERPDRGARVSYRFSIRHSGPAHAAGRRVRLFAEGCKGWRIARASGTLDPDGQVAELSPASGELVFTVEASPRCRWWLPPFVELPAESDALDRLLPPLPAPDRR